MNIIKRLEKMLMGNYDSEENDRVTEELLAFGYDDTENIEDAPLNTITAPAQPEPASTAGTPRKAKDWNDLVENARPEQPLTVVSLNGTPAIIGVDRPGLNFAFDATGRRYHVSELGYLKA